MDGFFFNEKNGVSRQKLQKNINDKREKDFFVLEK